MSLSRPTVPDPTPEWKSPAWESCRECRDEREWLAPAVRADFILWEKLFPPEALGPRCYDHAAKHIGSFNMGRIDQWAVFDLRPVRAALDASLEASR